MSAVDRLRAAAEQVVDADAWGLSQVATCERLAELAPALAAAVLALTTRHAYYPPYQCQDEQHDDCPACHALADAAAMLPNADAE